MALVPPLRKRTRVFSVEELQEEQFEGKFLKKLKEEGGKNVTASPLLRRKMTVVELPVVECEDCKVRVPLKDIGLARAPVQWKYRCCDCEEGIEEEYEPALVFGLKEE